MTTTTQQTTDNPALDHANAILEETNNALELIEILHGIAEGSDPRATTNDRIAAANILSDRGFGKCPKQAPAPNPDPTPKSAESQNHGSDNPSRSFVPLVDNAPDTTANPRPVTQIKDTLDQALGPAPTTHSPLIANNSLLETIQQHILTITNNGQTLRATLLEIARTEDDPKITPYHRRRAAGLLLDRVLGANPTLTRNALCPDCRQGWTSHACSPDHLEQAPDQPEEDDFDEELWAGIIAELKQKEEDGILHPDPNAPKKRYPISMPPKGFDPDLLAQEAARFRAENERRLQRQKNWPQIEERRRQKRAEMYPSHSNDDEDAEPPEP